MRSSVAGCPRPVMGRLRTPRADRRNRAATACQPIGKRRGRISGCTQQVAPRGVTMTQVRTTRTKRVSRMDELPELMTPAGRRLPW